MENFAILPEVKNSLAGCDAQDSYGDYFFLIVAKTRLERAVEIKSNGSTQNKKNLALLLEKHL